MPAADHAGNRLGLPALFLLSMISWKRGCDCLLTKKREPSTSLRLYAWKMGARERCLLQPQMRSTQLGHRSQIRMFPLNEHTQRLVGMSKLYSATWPAEPNSCNQWRPGTQQCLSCHNVILSSSSVTPTSSMSGSIRFNTLAVICSAALW